MEGNKPRQWIDGNITAMIQAMLDDLIWARKKYVLKHNWDKWTNIKFKLWIESDKYTGTYNSLACIWPEDT